MAFFKKLKDRMFQSSSKIEAGLDAIVEDGGVEEDVAAAQVIEAAASDAAEVEAQARAALDEQAAVVAQEEARIAEFEREVQGAERVEAQRQQAAELEDVARAEERDRLAADARRAEDAQQESEARKVELARQASVAAAEQAQRAEELGQAEAARSAEDARLEAERAEREKAAKPGLIGRLLGRGDAKTVVRRELDDDMLERLEELLISADMGVDTALRVTSNMAEGRFGKRLSTQEIKELLAAEITRIMEPVARPMPLYPTKPQVVLVVGVNGSGKTTTIGKLASQFQAAGKKVVIAAGDTFRAAAVEQLQVWAIAQGSLC